MDKRKRRSSRAFTPKKGAHWNFASPRWAEFRVKVTNPENKESWTRGFETRGEAAEYVRYWKWRGYNARDAK